MAKIKRPITIQVLNPKTNKHDKFVFDIEEYQRMQAFMIKREKEWVEYFSGTNKGLYGI